MNQNLGLSNSGVPQKLMVFLLIMAIIERVVSTTMAMDQFIIPGHEARSTTASSEDLRQSHHAAWPQVLSNRPQTNHVGYRRFIDL